MCCCATAITLKNTFFGFVIGVSSGFAAGLLLGRSDRLSAIFQPFITAVNSIPRIALAPIIVLDRKPAPGVTGGGHHSQREHQPMITSYEFLANWLRARVDDDRGASLVEYALLVALIAVVCIVAITFLGNNASSKFNSVGTAVN